MSQEKNTKVEETKTESLIEEKSSRRALFGLGVAALATGLASCGKTSFKGELKSIKTVDGKPKPAGGDDQKAESPDSYDPGANEDPNKEGNGEEAPGEQEGAQSEPEQADPGGNNDDPMEEMPEDPVVVCESSLGFAEVDFTGFADGSAKVSGHTLYGTKASGSEDRRNGTMLCLALNVDEGTTLQLLKPSGDESKGEFKGEFLASRVVMTGQKGKVAQIFDNLYVKGESELYLLMHKGQEKSYAKISLADSYYADKFKNMSVYDFEDAAKAGVAEKYHELMPLLEFDKPLDAVELGKQTGTKRPMKIAKAGSTWSANPLRFPGTTAPAAGDIIVADPVGRVIPLDGTLLQTHANFIVYVKNGSKYHRYFFFMG